ncbi:MAG: sigma-54 dependent transcriptional regulator [Pseudomonadota bacterium]
MSRARLLLVDDDAAFCNAARNLLSRDGYEVDTATRQDEATQKLSAGRYDLLLTDLSLPDGSGLELIQPSGPPAVIMTGHPSLDSAIGAVRGQVVDYLVKPLNHRALGRAIERALKKRAAAPDRRSTRRLVGDSECMRRLRADIEQYARVDETILITGESGTGKELIANALHEARAFDGPIVTVNCGAIAPELLASELFGHEKGAFTGAHRRRAGVFEAAGKGTVFLDEVGELPMAQQAALLRVTEQRRVMPVGGHASVPVHARIVAATNRDLHSLADAGVYRRDLVFRLTVLTLVVPPLRDRMDDLDQLIEALLADINGKHGTPVQLAQSALEPLRRHVWPGNVRELRNVLLRAALAHRNGAEIRALQDDFVPVAHLPGNRDTIEPGMAIRDVEEILIRKTLEHFGGRRKESAAALGVSLKTLYNRLQTYEATKRRQ